MFLTETNLNTVNIFTLIILTWCTFTWCMLVKYCHKVFKCFIFAALSYFSAVPFRLDICRSVSWSWASFSFRLSWTSFTSCRLDRIDADCERAPEKKEKVWSDGCWNWCCLTKKWGVECWSHLHSKFPAGQRCLPQVWLSWSSPACRTLLSSHCPKCHRPASIRTRTPWLYEGRTRIRPGTERCGRCPPPPHRTNKNHKNQQQENNDLHLIEKLWRK